MAEVISLILAAGKGTRMKSSLPKVLHPIGGRPMVSHVLRAAGKAGAIRNIVITGFGSEQVRQALGDTVEFVEQFEQLGTGHAVMQARPLLENFQGTVLVLCGDTPLLQGESLRQLVMLHEEKQAAATLLTALMPDPSGYGRIIRNAVGRVEGIVEQKDASAEQLAIQEINTGIYCFDSQLLLMALQELTPLNAQGEYYLTDVIGILARQGQSIWALAAEHYQETAGINSRSQLAEAERVMRKRTLQRHMEQGVTIMDTESTFIDDDVEIGADTVIYPFTWLEKGTRVGSHCVIGPNTRLTQVEMGNACQLQFVYGHECVLEDRVIAGPYVHLRPQTHLHSGVKIGNFVEVKNSDIGENTKLPHLSYIGDTDMGSGVNVGCGAITVNFDGYRKHRTVVGDNSFIGCNSNLVAPVRVGDGAYVAAGSTINGEVPANSLAIARARQENKVDWMVTRKNKREE